MPQVSERKRILDDLENTISAFQLFAAQQVVLSAGEGLFEDEDMELGEEEEEDRLDEAQDALSLMMVGQSLVEVLQDIRRTTANRRYLEGRPVWRELAAERTTRIEGLFSCDNNWFKETCRLNYEGFLFVLDQIKDDPIFFNNSRNPQAPAEYQLLVALSRFGHSGNSVGTRAVANAFRIAEGTCVMWMRRVIVALLSIQDRWVQWPDQERRKMIKTRIGQQSAFPQCLGYVDGSHVPLDIKPAYKGNADFYNHKGRYALNVLLVTDDENKINFFSVGWGGSAHDARVFRNTPIFREPERFFEAGECLLADSAFAATPTVIPAYKERIARCAIPLPDRQRFNKELSRQRVRVEHAIGMLKCRFQSLKGLRYMITNRKTFTQCLLHIRACIILHNMTLALDDDTFWEEMDVPALEAEWETEEREIRRLMAGDDAEAEGRYLPRGRDQQGENMREALRYHFQVNDYRHPYTNEAGF